MPAPCISCPSLWRARAVTRNNSRRVPRDIANVHRATSHTAEAWQQARPAQPVTKSRTSLVFIAFPATRRMRVTANAPPATMSMRVELAPTAPRAWLAIRTSPTMNPTRSAAPAATPSSVDGPSASIRVFTASTVPRSAPTPMGTSFTDRPASQARPRRCVAHTPVRVRHDAGHGHRPDGSLALVGPVHWWA